MKKIVLVFYCILLFSCKSQQISLSPYVAVYKSDRVGNIYPEYIILKTQPEIFEIYVPGIRESVFGEWNINNDTLFIFPKYEYFRRDSEMKFLKITLKDSSVSTIPQQYLIKNNCLIDITDYSVFLDRFFLNDQNDTIEDHKPVYKRVTKK